MTEHFTLLLVQSLFNSSEEIGHASTALNAFTEGNESAIPKETIAKVLEQAAIMLKLSQAQTIMAYENGALKVAPLGEFSNLFTLEIGAKHCAAYQKEEDKGAEGDKDCG